MRRIRWLLPIAVAAGWLAGHLAGDPSREDVPLLGEAIALEEAGGGGGRPLALEEAVPAESTRLAARGVRSGTRYEPAGVSAPSNWLEEYAAPRNTGRYDPPPELPEPPSVSGSPSGAADADAFLCVERLRAPWELQVGSGPPLVLVRRGETVGADVTERAYAVDRGLARLVDDPGERRGATSPFEGGRELYDRTGAALWKTPGTWIGRIPGVPPSWHSPLYVRQTAAGHRAVEAALDELVHVGGDARTIRVWRGDLGPGTLDVGEMRRLDASIPWRAAAEGPAVAGPLELDVPTNRVVTAFLGEAHVFVADYEMESPSYVSVPIYDLAHDGLSVRARSLSDPEEVELELVELRHAAPFATFSTSPALGSVPHTVTIEIPKGRSSRAVVRLPAREGEAWIVGLGGTRAALVEVARAVTGAGPRRPGWARHPSLGLSGAPADPGLAHAEPRNGARPPDGSIHAGLVRPSRTEGASPWSYRVELETEGAGALTPFGGLDRTREEALPYGGSTPYAGATSDPDRELVLRGGTCVRARWVGGTSEGEAYDVVVSVAEPLGMRDGPPIYLDPKPTYGAVRLPSFRRALVPIRIVVPHGGAGRRTVTLDLGRGPEPWTVTLSGGERTE